MSEWRGLHNPDFHVELNSYSIHCDYCACPCRRDLMCRCCGQAEVERLTALLKAADDVVASQDRRIARALDLMNDRANSSPGYPVLERVLRGESDE